MVACKRLLLVLLAGFVLGGCGSIPVPKNVVIDRSCGDDEEIRKRIVWSIRYMRAAARSRAFVHCMRLAVNRVEVLQTDQESGWVGPYAPCNGAPGTNHRDPEFAQTNPELGWEAAIALAQTQIRQLEIRCGNAGGSTAAALTEYDYFDPDILGREIIELSLNVFTEFPSHQQNGYVDPPEHGNLGPSYSVDELAGIILHERLHTRGFEHGNADTNNCGYTDGFDCPVSGSPANCRMSSLNEITEACMSEVLENSLGRCPNSFGGSCTDPATVPIHLQNLSPFPACECVPWF